MSSNATICRVDVEAATWMADQEIYLSMTNHFIPAQVNLKHFYALHKSETYH